MRWEDLENDSQVYLYWDYCASLPENESISFQEFNEMMKGFVF